MFCVPFGVLRPLLLGIAPSRFSAITGKSVLCGTKRSPGGVLCLFLPITADNKKTIRGYEKNVTGGHNPSIALRPGNRDRTLLRRNPGRGTKQRVDQRL